ncbi:hypothetical protein FACUT_5670 [Fusarium acutatum]|uniref:Uncharacterized protein n=1 Tax=Fusarium acutatum TaxID=78861 RepID=A0A8H4JR75_9HYPO|nr:hypothetical protein FACUT_5670 [Fusarium acutatum]
MNPKHVTYPMRFDSDGEYLKPFFGEEEIPMFQSVIHMKCPPYWYRFFVKNLPPRPWPLTINGRPFTIAPKTTEDLLLTTISGSHPAYPKVMEVMLTMDQKIVISVGWEINLKSKANQLPGYLLAVKLFILGCTILVSSDGVTGAQDSSPIAGGLIMSANYLYSLERGGVLIKNQEDQHMMTTAARIVRPVEVVGMREFFLQNRIGLTVDVVPGTDVALVRLDEAINYKNQAGTMTFTRLLGEDPDDALPWTSIVSLATRWPPVAKGIIVAKSVRVVRHPATTHYRVYHWAWTGQPGDEKGPNPVPRDTMIGAAAISETGVVVGLLHSNERGLWAGYSVMLTCK